MEIPIFYAEPSTIIDGQVALSKTESHHASRVLRLKKGEIVIVVDGLGNGYRGDISRIARDGLVEIRVHSHARNFGEPGVVLSLAAGLSAGYKFDTVVEKGTELGVKRFIPLITEKSKVKIDDPKRARTKINRYEKVALAAMKQCRRAYRPEISSPVKFSDYLREIDTDSLTLLFHPSSQSGLFEDTEFDRGLKRVNVIVGSESGFTPDEIDLATAKGVKLVSLGSRILRTETAGPVVCALVMSKLGELR